MGSWGTGLSSNDVFEDVKHEFFEKYNDGESPDNIKNIVIKNNQDIINSHEDSNNFWFALAFCLWECKALDKETFEVVKDIVTSGKDLALWKELDASQSDITKRKNVLSKYLEKISISKDKPKKRKKKTFRDSFFKKGDCISIRVNKKTFSGAIVLESEQNTEFGLNLIALLDCFSSVKPSVDDIKNANVLVTTVNDIKNNPQEHIEISWHYVSMIKKSDFDYETIGNIDIKRTFSSKKDYQSFANWLGVPEVIEHRMNQYKEKGKPKKIIKVKSIIKKKWF